MPGWLVLTRKVEESVMIGDSIEIKVVPSRDSSRVRLAIRAPLDVPVLRKELYNLKAKQEGPNDAGRD